jgi:cytochrome c peroxidase
MVARDPNLAQVYDRFAEGYEARGGDRNVVLGLGWSRDFSSEWSPATGTVRLDLIAGKVAASVKGLGDLEADLWLVDNDPDKSVRPQAGERMVRIGRLQKDGGLARISRHLGPAAFHDFELDLVVVTRAGRTPVHGMVLLGTRSYFETVYTRARLITERQREAERPTWTSFFRPAVLASLFRPRSAEANSTQILIAHNLVGQDVGDGGDLFFRGLFGGNGRTCGTCHRPANNLGLDVEFIETLPATDKLFVASFPPEQGGVPGLERPELLRQFALILENVDGLENPTVKFTMRGVPHTESLIRSITKPNDTRQGAAERTGWSGDGAPAPGTLTLFPDGAVRQHFTKSLLRREGIDFVLPTVTQETKMRAYMLATGRTSELALGSVSLTNAGANAGRILFLDNAVAKCNRCHGNAGANVGNNTNVNFDTGVETVVHPARAVEDFPFDGGFGATPAAPCKGDPNRTCFGDATFNTPPLIEAADTEPFFHNNVIADVEGSVAFYDSLAFNNSAAADPVTGVGPIDLTPQQIQDIAAFLRVINASFNADIAIQRNSAALTLENSSDAGDGGCGGGGGETSLACGGGDDVTGKRETVNTLLSLSIAEALDAVEVLTARSLHADAVKLFNSAIGKNNSAINELASQKRKSLISGALNDLKAAKAKFGSGLNLDMGAGNLLF